MTQETLETLTVLALELEKTAANWGRLDAQSSTRSHRQIADRRRKEAAALRDVLTPRTCGTCRHLKYPGPYRAACGNPESAFRGAVFYSYEASEMDGCLKGWQPREGEGGTR